MTDRRLALAGMLLLAWLAAPARAGDGPVADARPAAIAGDPVLARAVLDALPADDGGAHHRAAQRIAKLPWRDLAAAVLDPGEDPHGFREDALRAALVMAGPEAMREMLVAAAEEKAPPALRLLAWQTAARDGCTASLDEVVAPMRSSGGMERDGVAGTAAFRDAVTACLRRSHGSAGSVASVWSSLSPVAREALLDGIEAAGRDGGDRVIALIVASADSDRAAALDRLARTPFRRPMPVAGAAESSVRRAAEDRDPAARAAAATILGRLGGFERAGILHGMLADPDRSVVTAAVRALRNASGAELGPDPELWLVRLEDERLWITGQGAADLALLESDEPGTTESIPGALGRIAAHPLHAERVIPVIERHATSPEPQIRAAACAALGRLRSSRSLRALAECLDDPDPTVADAAGAALAAVTGLPRPKDVAEWKSQIDAGR